MITPEQRAIIRQRIRAAISQTQADIADLELQNQPISPDNAIGRVSRMDAINNKGVTEASLRRSRQKLSKLEHALSQIDTDNFAKCKNCGKDIAPRRLLFMPETTHCINCAKRK